MKRTLCVVTLSVALLVPVSLRAADSVGWHASGKGGAVAAGGADAVKAGIGILEKGGNAADAATATLLALAVTDYGLFAMGGEVPLIIYDEKSGKVKTLSAPQPRAGPRQVANDRGNRQLLEGARQGTERAGGGGAVVSPARTTATERSRDAPGPTGPG